MPRLLALTVALVAPLAGCGDKAEVTCDALCSGALEITFADGREEFELDITGTGFSVTASCPEEAYSGNQFGMEIECEGATVILGMTESNYPSEMSFLEDGDRWDLSPEYDVEELCGLTCESAVITLD